jgi:outer membrane immunogenic protein
MKKIIALAVIAAACSTSSFAQVSNFTGFSAAANLTSIKTDTTPQGEAALSGRGTGANLQAAYGFDLAPEYVLSVGATYGLSNNKAGGYVDTNETGNLKLKKQLSIYVEPGYLVSPQTLVYGKVSYESATDEVTSSVPANSDSADIKGVGLGFGVRTMIDKNWFAQAEYKQTKFDKKMSNAGTNLDVKNSGVSVGIGYRF